MDHVNRIVECKATFECPICLEDTDANPAITPCGYLLCWECFHLVESTTTTKDGGQRGDIEGESYVRCPVCRMGFRGVTCWKAFCYFFLPAKLDAEEAEAIGAMIELTGGVSQVAEPPYEKTKIGFEEMEIENSSEEEMESGCVVM
jgi:hypothetical protein